MKKLMILAAVAALSAGAFADDCGCAEPSPCTEPCPFGYQIKIYLKTTQPGTIKEAPTCGCEETAAYCLRKPGIVRFAGFIYGTTEAQAATCSEAAGCECNDWAQSELVMWNYDTKKEVAPNAQLHLLDRIFNGDTTTAEICFSLDQMTYAGFGRVAKRNGKWTLKSASGFGAGLLPQQCSECEKSCDCSETCTTAPVQVWLICADESKAPNACAPYTAAYGKWTIDWSATVYNRLNTKQQVTKPGADWEQGVPVLFSQNEETFAGECADVNE